MNVLMGTGERKGDSGFDLEACGAPFFTTSSGRRFTPDRMGTLMYFEERRDGEVSLFMLFLLVV